MFNFEKARLRIMTLAAVFGWVFLLSVESASADTLLQKFEAENGTIVNPTTNPMKIRTDQGVTFIETLKENEGTASYTVTIDDTDTATNNDSGFYKIKTRVLGMYDASDCFYFNIDGQPASYYKWDIPRIYRSGSWNGVVANADWKEMYAQGRIPSNSITGSAGFPYEFYLGPGTHTITIRGGENEKPRCSNGKDDEGYRDSTGTWIPTPDGYIDYPRDPECASSLDNDEGPKTEILPLTYYTSRLDWLEIIKIDTPTVKKWEPYEIRLLSANSYTNAYTQDVSVTGTFRHTGTNQQITVKGFWNGKNFNGKDKFIVRFTPTEDGEWKYEITNDQADDGLAKTGSLVADPEEQGNHGFVRVDKNNPTSFIYDDGERYFMTGTTAYDIMENSLDDYNREGWKRTIDFLSTKKINKVRFFLFPFSSNVGTSDYMDQMPFTGGQFAPSLNTPRVGYWQQVEEMIKYMAVKGIVADLILFANEERDFGTDAQDERYVKYAVNRFAAYPNVIWDLANEWNYRIMDDKSRKYANDDTKISWSRWNSIGNLVFTADPWSTSKDGYRRPLSIHEAAGVNSAGVKTAGIFDFFEEDWASYAILQVEGYLISSSEVTYDDKDYFLTLAPYNFKESDDDYGNFTYSEEVGNFSINPNFESKYNTDHIKPVVNDEFGYTGESETREGTRKALWGIYVAGGYASIGDAYTLPNCNSASPGGKKNFKSGDHCGGESGEMGKTYNDVKRLNEFFTDINRGIEYWKMRGNNNDALIADWNSKHAYALANPGVDYVVYDADGGEFTINLEAGKKYEVTKFSPRSDEISETILGIVSGGSQTFGTIGDTKDWVYRFKKTGSDGPCTLISAAWSQTDNVTEGKPVNLIVTGDENCGARELRFEIKEHDPGFDESVSSNPANVYFSGNTATATWNVKWQNDAVLVEDDPEYFFTATLTENQGDPQSSISSSTSDNQMLHVAKDTTPPSAPTNLVSPNFTYNKVDLSWNASTDNGQVASYKIYRDGSVIATVNAPQTTYSDTNVASNTTYTYQVSAVDAVNLESGKSNTVSVFTKKADPLRFEGEDAAQVPNSLASPMRIADSMEASEGKYIESTVTDGQCGPTTGYVAYPFHVENGGKYKITARTYAYNPGNDPNHDSFCVQIDNQTPVKWLTNRVSNKNNFWEENDVRKSFLDNSLYELDFAAGTDHTIKFIGRKSLTRLDYFYLKPTSFTSQCSDNIDNDGDELKDYGTAATNDPGCDYPTDNDETDTLPPFAKEDIDHNRAVNIKDVQLCVIAINSPGSLPDPAYLSRCQAVAPPDTVVNIKDIQAIIRAIINS